MGCKVTNLKICNFCREHFLVEWVCGWTLRKLVSGFVHCVFTMWLSFGQQILFASYWMVKWWITFFQCFEAIENNFWCHYFCRLEVLSRCTNFIGLTLALTLQCVWTVFDTNIWSLRDFFERNRVTCANDGIEQEELSYCFRVCKRPSAKSWRATCGITNCSQESSCERSANQIRWSHRKTCAGASATHQTW